MTKHIGTERIHDLLDGLLTAAEEAEVEAHVAACDACRRDVADMQEIVGALRTLPGAAEAPEVAWQGIEARIRGTDPGAQREEATVVAFPGAREARRRFHFTLPQLAAAAVVVSLLSAGVVWSVLTPGALGPEAGPVAESGVDGAVRAASVESLETPAYAEAVAELEAVVDQGRDVLSPETVATLDQALATIDGALAEVRQALAEDPSSQLLGRMLVNHQRARLRVLRQAATAVQAVS
jgi:anti-sigma factor RsiW